MSQSPKQELFSLSLLRLVGYGLLAIALIEFINLIIPPRLMNPAWELQTIGAFVEQIPVLLLAMVLIYCGERSYRAPVEGGRRAEEKNLLPCFSINTDVFSKAMSNN